MPFFFFFTFTRKYHLFLSFAFFVFSAVNHLIFVLLPTCTCSGGMMYRVEIQYLTAQWPRLSLRVECRPGLFLEQLKPVFES